MSALGFTGEAFRILLVEDNPAHAHLVMRSFEDHRVANEILHLADGEQALDYLHRRGRFAEAPTGRQPHVMLLDLRLPKVDGLEVLRQVKSSEVLRDIPVVVLTTSAAERDVAKAYEYHANSYVVKPLDFDKFTDLMDELGLYWLGWNHFPRP